jgi:hypothetical protein
VRPIETEDLRFLYAAYKVGNLESMGDVFSDRSMNPPEFRAVFEDELMSTYHGAWSLFAPNEKGLVGVVLGFWTHPDPDKAPFMVVGDMLWMPWATTRNKIESAVHFFNEVRKEYPMVQYACAEEKRFFETIAKHGIMRRVGTSYNVYRDGATTIFETRAVEACH